MEYFYNSLLNRKSLHKLVDKAIAQETEYVEEKEAEEVHQTPLIINHTISGVKNGLTECHGLLRMID